MRDKEITRAERRVVVAALRLVADVPEKRRLQVIMAIIWCWIWSRGTLDPVIFEATVKAYESRHSAGTTPE